MQASLLLCPWALQPSWDVEADAGFVNDKTAVLRYVIKGGILRKVCYISNPQ